MLAGLFRPPETACEFGDADPVSEFRDTVAAATQGTPYTVVDSKKGFDVLLDVADAQWWGLYNRAGLRKSFRWRVKERPSHFTIVDRQVEMTWRAGVPVLGGSMEVQGGRVISLSRQKIWALSERGRVEPVVNYRFNSREGRDLIRLVARQLGLKERQPLSFLAPMAMLAVSSVGFAIWGVVALILHFTGGH
jgi:hypothetical protein